MPSPFPGMDPYIEAPQVWSDFHQDIATRIRTALNGTIQPRYVARLAPYVTYEEIEISAIRSMKPDVAIVEALPGPPAGASTVAISPTAVESSIPLEFPLRLASVEVMLVETQELVTAIEILSPVNKRPSHEAFGEYGRKRRRLLRSDVHLVEIDLLRGGTRPELGTPVPSAPYYVVLSRAERRPQVDVWPIQIRDSLPSLPVPLRAPDPDAQLDLQGAVAAVYEGGGYATLIDYSRPVPPPALSPSEGEWVAELLSPIRARR